MLANFGQVRGWNMTPAEMVAERPRRPVEGSQQMAEERRSQTHGRQPHARPLAIAHKWKREQAPIRRPYTGTTIAPVEYLRTRK